MTLSKAIKKMFRSIRLQITLFFFIAISLSLIVTGAFLGSKHYSQLQVQQYSLQRQFLLKLNTAVNEYLGRLGGDLQLIADIAAVKGLDSAEQYILLKSLQLRQNAFRNIIFVDRSHNVVHSSSAPRRAENDLFPEPDELFKLARASGKTRYLVRKHANKTPYLIIVTPVFFLNKDFINGVVAGILPLQDLAKSMHNTGMEKNSHTALYSSEGELISSFSRQFPYELFPFSYFATHSDLHCASKNEVIYGTTPIALLEPPTVLAEGHHFNHWKVIQLEIQVLLIFLVVILIVVFTLGRKFIKRTLAKPLMQLEEGAKEIQKGNYTHQINMVGENEFSHLAQAFNTMSDKLTKTFTKLDSTIQHLHEEIEKRQQTNAQLRHADKLASVGRLSSSIAHEFGNPLVGIRLLFKDMRNWKKFNAEQKEYLDLGIHECERMQGFIRQLQQVSRPSTQEKKDLDIHLILKNTLQFHKKLLTQHKIRTKILFLRDTPIVSGVEDQLTQVFFNLTNNAIDAMAPTGGVLTITTAIKVDTLSISFTDTGRGIHEEDCEKIFEPFFSTKSETEGTGLGLYVSYNIVTSHGGEIKAFSLKDKGSTFVILLPIKGLSTC